MTARPLIFALVAAALLLSTLSASPALAKPEMSAEQLAKAREIAAKMNPPVDFDTMLAEADRLGVECQGNLTIRANIKTCLNNIEIAQSKERVTKLDEETAVLREKNKKLDEEYKASQERTKKMLEEMKEIAKEKLKQK
jgi:hypothetical protein